MSDAQTECRMGPSRHYALVSVLLHAGAGIALLMTRLPPFLLCVLAALLALACVRDLRLNAWRSAAGAVLRVGVDSSGWWLEQRSGAISGPLHPEIIRRGDWGVLLVLRDRSRRRRSLVIPADAAPARSLRRLRIAALAATGSARR